MKKKKTHFEEYVEQYKSGQKTGYLLSIEDIEPKDMVLISNKIFRSLSKTNNEDEMYNAYLSVLAEHGIICPHPQHKRLYCGYFQSKEPLSSYPWYECTMCGCGVINELKEEGSCEKKKDSNGRGDEEVK